MGVNSFHREGLMVCVLSLFISWLASVGWSEEIPTRYVGYNIPEGRQLVYRLKSSGWSFDADTSRDASVERFEVELRLKTIKRDAKTFTMSVEMCNGVHVSPTYS